MGTRGLTGFVVENQVKASYQQYDSYPSGVGVDVLDFAQKLADGAPDALIELRVKLAKKVLVNEGDQPTAEQKRTLIAAGYEPQAVSSGEDFYAWLRDDQGDPQRLADAPFMLDSQKFGEDSLFCEWAYLIDTDAQTLEVYQGFQNAPHTDGRWADKPVDSSGYAPIRLVQTYRLSALPTRDQFLADLEPGDE